MENILTIVASNVIVSSLLAMAIFVYTRIDRRPTPARFLWSLVLIKLITPPITSYELPVNLSVNFTAPNITATEKTAPEIIPKPNAKPKIKTAPFIAQLPQKIKIVPPEITPIETRPLEITPLEIAPPETKSLANKNIAKPQVIQKSEPTMSQPTAPQNWSTRFLWSLFFIWGTGTTMFVVRAVWRIRRMQSLIRRAPIASPDLTKELTRIGAILNLKRLPILRTADALFSPFFWTFGRTSTIVLPKQFTQELPQQQRELIIAHELIHLQNRDHWRRFTEMIVLSIYWWNPIAWWTARQLQNVDEQYCDALTLSLFPQRQRDYAVVLVETATLTSQASRRTTSQLATSGANLFFRNNNFLKERIQMILNHKPIQRMSRYSRLFGAILAVAILPFAIQTQTHGTPPTESPFVESESSPRTDTFSQTVKTSPFKSTLEKRGSTNPTHALPHSERARSLMPMEYHHHPTLPRVRRTPGLPLPNNIFQYNYFTPELRKKYTDEMGKARLKYQRDVEKITEKYRKEMTKIKNLCQQKVRLTRALASLRESRKVTAIKLEHLAKTAKTTADLKQLNQLGKELEAFRKQEKTIEAQLEIIKKHTPIIKHGHFPGTREVPAWDTHVAPVTHKLRFVRP